MQCSHFYNMRAINGATPLRPASESMCRLETTAAPASGAASWLVPHTSTSCWPTRGGTRAGAPGQRRTGLPCATADTTRFANLIVSAPKLRLYHKLVRAREFPRRNRDTRSIDAGRAELGPARRGPPQKNPQRKRPPLMCPAGGKGRPRPVPSQEPLPQPSLPAPRSWGGNPQESESPVMVGSTDHAYAPLPTIF